MKRSKLGLHLVRLSILLQFVSLFGAPREAVATRHRTHKHISYTPTPRGMNSPAVQLYQWAGHVAFDNGILEVTFSTPAGMITGIKYHGIDNLLESDYAEDNRGYYDIYWNKNSPQDTIDKLEGTRMSVVKQDDDGIEISFVRTWNTSKTGLPLNIDKRFVMLRGSSGFYSYAILERLEDWPAVILSQGRMAFKLNGVFDYMAVSDDRQRIMPTTEDRERGQPLDFPEAVLLTNPANPSLRGEVDDKYQYSSDNKDCRVHGWISTKLHTGFWVITPSNEFKMGGPVKQDLTSHAGPISLSMFFSTHYAGVTSVISFGEGETWKKVFGPVFIYVNSVSRSEDPLKLWADAKEQMFIETQSWPYDFPASADFLPAEQRGVVSGRLLVQDSYISDKLMNANNAYIGLALPGKDGSWQRENKGYQFWTQADNLGYFIITGILPGKYSLNAWVPGFIGDYMLDYVINVQPGGEIKIGHITFEPPRIGPTVWEIGIPDRTAAEFFVPDPNPGLMNQLYLDQADKFRQYGLWDSYTNLYPDHDLVYTVETCNYQTDWFFAQVNRKTGKTYKPTTWTIKFNLTNVVNDSSASYTLRIALASATDAELQVRINDASKAPFFSTGLIGKDNTVARHGIHGFYWLFTVNIPASMLFAGSTNAIYLTQSRAWIPWRNVMYDCLRLEAPYTNNSTQT